MPNDKRSEQEEILLQSYWAARGKLERSRKISIVLRVYALSGMLLFVVGAMYFVLSLYGIDLTREQTIAVIVSGAGLLISIVSLGVSNLWRHETEVYRLELRDASMQGNLVGAWGEFEKVVRSALSDAGRNTNDLRLRPLLTELTRIGLISEDEFTRLKQALDVRNAVAHGSDFHPPQEIADLTEFVARITTRVARGSNEGERASIS